MINTLIRVANQSGAVLGYISEYSNLRYVLRGDGKIGGCSFTVPLYFYDWLNPTNPDMRITIWRSINNMIPKLENDTEYLTVIYDITDMDITVTAYSLNILLSRRIIAYPADDTTYTKFDSINAGNIMKTLVRQNLSTGVNVSRDGNDTNVSIQNLTVTGNANDGIVMSKACSRNNLYDTIQEIATTSQQSGSWIVGVITSNGSNWTFDTYPTKYGIDRRNQTPLSLAYGNIEEIKFIYDYSSEYNFAIIAGAGTGVGRIIGTSIAPNATMNPYSRKEFMYSNPAIRDVATATDSALSCVRAFRPLVSLKCKLIQTPVYVRGINYNIGDILSVFFNGIVYSVRLDIIEVRIDETGSSETAELRLI